MTVFYTIGHSTRTFSEFANLLAENKIEHLIDVRSYPGSRHCPHFNKETFEANLEPYNIKYSHLLKLGGRRPKNKSVSPIINALWTHPAFKNYADYSLSDDFASGLRELKTLGRELRVAYMCSESVWWKCHRRIITDYLLASGDKVIHIMSAGKLEDATRTNLSGCCNGRPTYFET